MLPETLKIRPACRDDVPFLLEAEKICFTDPWQEGSFAAFMSGGSFGTWVAVDAAGTLCGYLCVIACPPEFEIANIAVLPALRRVGMGQRLLSFALQTAQEQGCTAAYLEVRASNAPAVSLYEKNGFLRTGLRRNYYESPAEDAILMMKRIGTQPSNV